MATVVINISRAPIGWQSDPQFVYIGRAGKGLSGEYGNPHVAGYCAHCNCVHHRSEAIALFRIEAERRYAAEPEYRAFVEKLRGKTLVCFCKPKPCHGGVYVRLLNRKES